jgi:hypothetical protein
VGKSLQELTTAYMAIEGVLRSALISQATRDKLEMFLSDLEKDIAKALRERIHSREDESSAADRASVSCELPPELASSQK